MYFISTTKLMCRKRGCLEEKLEKQQINHNNRQPWCWLVPNESGTSSSRLSELSAVENSQLLNEAFFLS